MLPLVRLENVAGRGRRADSTTWGCWRQSLSVSFKSAGSWGVGWVQGRAVKRWMLEVHSEDRGHLHFEGEAQERSSNGGAELPYCKILQSKATGGRSSWRQMVDTLSQGGWRISRTGGKFGRKRKWGWDRVWASSSGACLEFLTTCWPARNSGWMISALREEAGV